jgi:hypothetical protein
MEENPYESPNYSDTSVEASLGEGEEILFQTPARSPSKRGWPFGLPEQVTGRFVVTNRRVVFLSSGTLGTFGITESTMVRRIAASVDFAAMCEKSSWEFELAKVRSAEASKPSIWIPRCLQLAGTDTRDMEVTHKVFPYGVKRKTWEQVVKRIKEMTRA